MALKVITAHELTLHRTNSGAAVALCSCGWGANVHPAPRRRSPSGRSYRIDYEHAEAQAAAEWHGHADILRAVESTVKLERALSIVHRPGRFSIG